MELLQSMSEKSLDSFSANVPVVKTWKQKSPKKRRPSQKQQPIVVNVIMDDKKSAATQSSKEKELQDRMMRQIELIQK